MVEVIYGAGKTGDLDLSGLEENKWPDDLDYFAQYMRFPELAVEVLDTQV